MKPFYQGNLARIYKGDALKVLKELPDESDDLLITDPPYGIGFMGKNWDKALPDKQIWSECLRVLKDGAFAFVMSIPRADCLSRMIISLEDAGFWVNFTPIFWAYASGFPKAQNIGKAVDKKFGIKRDKGNIRTDGRGKWALKMNRERGDTGIGHADGSKQIYQEEFATSPQAKALDGSYGGFQPKPAVEIIIVAMKPLSEKTFVDQALKNRKGITWLDEGRIPYESDGDKESARFGTQMDIRGGNLKTPIGIKARDILISQVGRFPANLLVSDDVLNDGRFTQSGKDAVRRQEGMFVEHRLGGVGNLQIFHPDSGSFSRYFDLDKWAQKTFPFLIVPKASKGEKDKLLDQPKVVKSCLPLRDGSGDYVENIGGDGSQSTRRTRARNIHPTVKPLKLMSYLVTLGSREGDVILDPFVGSGTTILASQLLNRRCIGIEIEEKYCEIAARRCSQEVMELV